MQNIMVVLKSREKRLNSLEANAAKGFKITNYSSGAVKKSQPSKPEGTGSRERTEVPV